VIYPPNTKAEPNKPLTTDQVKEQPIVRDPDAKDGGFNTIGKKSE